MSIFTTRLAHENWESKYKYGDETPLGTFIRVAKSLAQVEVDTYGADEEAYQHWYREFLQALVKFDPTNKDASGYEGEEKDLVEEYGRPVGLYSTPGGRITANIGTTYGKATAINCFIQNPVTGAEINYTTAGKLVSVKTDNSPDNLSNIFLSLLEAAETLKSEGGYGINFGFIRPRGSLIKGVGIRHPGVVAYMELWDKTSSVIVRGDNDGYVDKIFNHLPKETTSRVEKAQPRKGAMMAVLPIWHPDVEEFIRAKQKPGMLTKFNLSVLIDDAFMFAVQKDEFYHLHFQGKVYKVVKARELYDLIMESTYNRSDPGVLFFDNMNRQNPLIYLGLATGTNPCVAEGTLVETPDGPVPVEDIKLGDRIQTTLGFGTVEVIEKHRDQPVFRVEFSDGTVLRVTEGHIFHTMKDENGTEWDNTTRLKDLSVGVYVRTERFNHDTQEFESGKVQIEWIMTDGRATVYDLYEPESDDWNTHGIVSRGCGEIPSQSYLDPYYKPSPDLEPYLKSNMDLPTVCLLSSVNLTQLVNEDRTFDYERYSRVVRAIARMLDNVCDASVVPLPGYERVLKDVRQYGIGVNGLGSALMMLGLKYGSEESLEFTRNILQIKDEETMITSALLAKDRGPFPLYSEEYLTTPYFLNHCKASDAAKDLVRQYGLRNGKRLTNPPLGNSSVICDSISNGIEPVFSLGYQRTIIADDWPEGLTTENVKTVLTEETIGGAKVWRGMYNDQMYYYEPHNRGLCFIEVVTDYGYNWCLERGLVDGDEIITAQELLVDEHVAIQAVVQAYNDQSTSKTASCPNDYPFEDFRNLYMDAWKAGLVGFTTYRAGTMEAVMEVEAKQTSLLDALIEVGAVREDTEVTEAGVIVKNVGLPDQVQNGPTQTIRREGCKYYLNLSYLPNDPKHPIALWIHSNSQQNEYVTMNRAFKSVVQLLKTEGVDSALVDDQVRKAYPAPHHEKLGKIISMALRHCIDLPKVVGALSNIEDDYIATTLTAVRKFLMQQVDDGTQAVNVKCLACDSTDLIYESGCALCRSCGNSGCG